MYLYCAIVSDKSSGFLSLWGIYLRKFIRQNVTNGIPILLRPRTISTTINKQFFILSYEVIHWCLLYSSLGIEKRTQTPSIFLIANSFLKAYVGIVFRLISLFMWCCRIIFVMDWKGAMQLLIVILKFIPYNSVKLRIFHIKIQLF